MTIDKKRYENAIRRFRRYHKKGWDMKTILNDETYKRVIGKNKKEVISNDRRKRNQEGDKYMPVKKKNKPWEMT